jgi:hypothetical protein
MNTQIQKRNALRIAGLCGVALIGTAAVGVAASSGNRESTRTAADAGRTLVDRAAADVCRLKGESATLGSDLGEASGAAASAKHADVLWTHNDGGNSQLFAVDRAGKIIGRVQLAGVQLSDWESLDVGPCAGGQCLYVGDIGDNDAKRTEVLVYRIPEPAPGAKTTGAAEALRARYPDGPRDAEALIAAPDGALYIITKGDGGPVTVYRFPASAKKDEVSTLERVRVLGDAKASKGDWVTDAAMSPDGKWVAVRTQTYVDFYRVADFSGSGKAAHRMDLSSLKEAQGEGITFGADARTVFLTSEGGKKGVPGTMAELECELR